MAVGLSYRWLGGTGFDYIESSLVFSNLVDYPQDPINLDGFLADIRIRSIGSSTQGFMNRTGPARTYSEERAAETREKGLMGPDI
ncbi:hypothetical protein PCANC_04229 [Puccinia coronata f. sp. avenae]|uniref:Uncharacterized protein n=1 Tax=Puccinia coronata f. sp. avenae TaxID=200324 RepID=A0A2N5TFA4_9BASI|nr:hypothetical protein PCASD_09712 [Puccinia coronata f. sp. avenae]PLW54544.1 hypothetical protein PCANC_04229 [Puccinia coronata f. sp. avenae]